MKNAHCPILQQLPQQSEAALQRRRRLVIALGAGTFTGGLVGSFPARAQTGSAPARIAILASNNVAFMVPLLISFKEGMRENGLIEGKHYALDVVYADGRYERFPALVKELLERAPAVLMASTITAVRAAQLATRTVPIVMLAINDPVGNGLVASLARPGGNTTGIANQVEDIVAKNIEWLHEALPHAKRIALLINPGNPSNPQLGERIGVAARRIGIETRTFEAATPAAFDSTFAAIARLRPDALIVLRDAMLNNEPRRISAFALENRIPAFGPTAEFPVAGSLLSYASSLPDMYRRSASHVRKILAGAKPADLPVEQPTKFELVLNLKTAKALGIKIPQSLLITAERVIE